MFDSSPSEAIITTLSSAPLSNVISAFPETSTVDLTEVLNDAPSAVKATVIGTTVSPDMTSSDAEVTSALSSLPFRSTVALLPDSVVDICDTEPSTTIAVFEFFFAIFKVSLLAAFLTSTLSFEAVDLTVLSDAF